MTLEADASAADSADIPTLVDVLSTQRGRFTYPNQEDAERYRNLYAQMASAIGSLAKFSPPNLIVVSSASGLSEMVRHGLEQWIVYDTYLGTIFSQLNHLVDAGAPLRSSDAYLTRLYVARLLASGRTEEAFTLALDQVIRGSEDIEVLPNPISSAHSIVEEAYVLAHELGHAVFAANPTIAALLHDMYFDLCRAEAADVAERPYPSLDEAAASFADDYNREYVRRHGHISEEQLESGKKQLTNFFLSALQSFELPDSEQVRAEKELGEEVVCDAFAAVLVAHVMSDGTPTSTLEALAGAFNASQKLRMIKHMDAHIARHGSESKVLRDTTVRGRQLRQFLRAIYESGMTQALFGFTASDTDHSDMLERIRDLNQQFYVTIFDQLISGIYYEGPDGIITGPWSKMLSASTSTLRSRWTFVINYLGFGDRFDLRGESVSSA